MGNKKTKSKQDSTLQTANSVKIKVYKGKTQQGVNELKKNYVIDKNTKILGAGEFGRVF